MTGRASSLAAYAADWHTLAPRLARVARRLAARADYRRALAAGELLVVPAAAPTGRRFTVVMPVFRVAEAHLRAAIDSVRAQTHGNWELLLVDDASPEPHVARVLSEACRADARIRARRRGSNGGIAVASNEALADASGEFVAFVDHDDLVHPRALELADRYLAARGDVDWLFTDEDKVDVHGRHFQPCLKPGTSRQLLLAFNLVAHLRVVRRTLLDRLGGHREGFDGAQDYDLALRAAAAGARFAHLPGVLYHWRTVATSMALAAANKPAAHERALRALREHAASFPEGGAISVRSLIPAASFFAVRRACAADLPLAVLDAAGDGAPWTATFRRPVRVLPAETGRDLAQATARCRAASLPYLLLPPPRGLAPAEVEELLALLQVPGTGLVAGRAVATGRVAASGWLRSGDALWDPAAGLGLHDPGYLNLAAVPAPRLVPPAVGWAVRSDSLADALTAADDVPGPWRLAVGMHRLGLEVVGTPTVPFAAPPAATPAGVPPAELPDFRVDWLRYAGIRPTRA